MEDNEIKTLIDEAFKATKNAYAKYSNFKVGACVLTTDGNYFIGSNVENAAFGSTMCAERNALFHTYNLGYRQQDIKAVAIVADTDVLIVPCGACLQVFTELLNEETKIILASKEEYQVKTIDDLLPIRFKGESLNV